MYGRERENHKHRTMETGEDNSREAVLAARNAVSSAMISPVASTREDIAQIVKGHSRPSTPVSTLTEAAEVMEEF